MAATGRGVEASRLPLPPDDGDGPPAAPAGVSSLVVVDEPASSEGDAVDAALEDLERWKHRSDMTGCWCSACSCSS